jgi:hypothetical protein
VTDPSGNAHPACEDTVRRQVAAELRADAADYLKAGDSAKRRGDARNADWCYRAAWGAGRAIRTALRGRR